MSGQILFMGVMGEFGTSCLHRCCHFLLAGIPEDRINFLFCLFGDATHCWFDIPATGVLQAAGRNGGFYPVKTNPLWLETSQPTADFILNSMGVIFGVLVCLGGPGGAHPPCLHQPSQHSSALAAAPGNDHFAQPHTN